MHITLQGTLLLTLADTLAAHQLGGFKVGVGFALRKCRECMATRSDLQNKVTTIFVIDNNSVSRGAISAKRSSQL